MESVGEENAQELDNTGKEQIGFRSGGVGGFAMGHTEYRLEGTDGTLHGNPLEIESAPEVRIAEDTWVKAFVGVWIDVDTLFVEFLAVFEDIGTVFCAFTFYHIPVHFRKVLIKLGVWYSTLKN